MVPPEQHENATVDLRPRAFLLHQVATSPGRRLSRRDGNARIPGIIARELGLVASEANRLRDALVVEGLLASQKKGNAQSYTLTDAGTAYLEAIRDHVPSIPVRGGKIQPPADEATRKDRVACLLLQLLRAWRPLTTGEANKFSTFEKSAKGLHLTAATASQIRRELAASGWVTITKNGRTENYTLTPEGRQRLGTLEFCKDFPLSLSSSVLNDLLNAARDAAKDFEGPAPQPISTHESKVTSEELEQGILAAFEELSRERHAVSGLVPIHEVRASIREQFGPAASRHDVFDEAILGLWRAKRLGLSAITDHGHSTSEQLQDSIPGVGETLFYLKSAHEPAAV